MSNKKIKIKKIKKHLDDRKISLDLFIQNSFHPYIGYMITSKMVKEARKELEHIQYTEKIIFKKYKKTYKNI